MDLNAPTSEFITPAGIIAVLLLGALIVVLPRRYALLPILAMMCFMTLGQRILIFGLDFTLLRILVIFGWLRLILRAELQAFKMNKIDWLVIWTLVSSTVAYVILWGTVDSFIYKAGLAYNAVGFYFLFRFLIRDPKELIPICRQFALLLLPLAILMLIEYSTRRNLFAFLGGVPQITIMRAGAMRCQGPFAHPILAGTFGATVGILFAGLFRIPGQRWAATLGLAASAGIIFASGSSGPVLATLAGVAALVFWPLRNWMRPIRWGILFGIVGMHLVMKSPVWMLVGRVSVFSGSTGWHRAYLLDRAIYNLPEWWMFGTKTTSHWGYYLFDVTNHYVFTGVEGGLLTLILFLATISLCFGGVGRAVRGAEKSGEPRNFVFLLWSLGAVMMTHVTSFISVSYFDQNFVNWYLLLALIALIRDHNWAEGREETPAPAVNKWLKEPRRAVKPHPAVMGARTNRVRV